jgi:hypothetical protein
LSFASISSAMASLSASRTVISLTPPSDAYLLATMDGVIAAGRKAGRKAGAAGREADSRREAGRRSLEAAIELIEDGRRRAAGVRCRFGEEEVLLLTVVKSSLHASVGESGSGRFWRPCTQLSVTWKCWANSHPNEGQRWPSKACLHGRCSARQATHLTSQMPGAYIHRPYIAHISHIHHTHTSLSVASIHPSIAHLLSGHGMLQCGFALVCIRAQRISSIYALC